MKTYQPKSGYNPNLAEMGLAAPLDQHVVIPIQVSNGKPSLKNPNQNTAYIDQGQYALWVCNEPFTVWFDDPTAKREADTHSAKGTGYKYAAESKAKDFKYTNMPYDYHIDVAGGTLDPIIIIRPS
ncbi:hypothetical protein HPT27_03595 [Permianibacter sp. IMCC34836]|uniref:hypothetical protein n=1 Tax=Permianibacter fluminis TaxID=2738515 RepID=UPI0015533034|nr:hypothetical protein [Permianibacter fluminis]NQD36094.1 hypothetical protein [Permianibacter fluminis]